MNIANCMKVRVGRQKQVADGNHNRDIAEKLFVTEETVKVTHQAHHGEAEGSGSHPS
jgi:FixJ family two-component response regulator